MANEDATINNTSTDSGITEQPYPNDPESIRVPSDYTLEYVKLYPWNAAAPIDLTNVRGTINIFEDIFNNFITGNITVVDAWDLPMLYPLVGEEILEISFKRPGTKNKNTAKTPDYEYDSNTPIQYLEDTESFKMQFRVVKMTDRKLVRDRTQSYTLHFASNEFILNKKNKVGKSYKNTLYSDMVLDVYNTFLNKGKPIAIEKSMYEQNFVICNWTPSQSINIFASRSIPNGRVGSNYVFFETVIGFNFVSLEKLFEAKEKEIFLYQPNNIMLSPPNRMIDEESRNIYEFDYVEYFDVISNLQHGMYSSKLLTVDPIRRIYQEYDFDYAKEFDKVKHLEKNKLCTDGLDALNSPYARFNLMTTNKDHDKVDWIVSREPGIKPTQLESYVLQRQSQLQQINNVRLAITIPGNPERHAGDVISFSLPNAMGDPVRFGDEPEKYLSGRYLISAVRNRIEANGYYQDIEIIKDSFLSKIEYQNPIEIYKSTY